MGTQISEAWKKSNTETHTPKSAKDCNIMKLKRTVITLICPPFNTIQFPNLYALC